ncbi:MAG: hypothetical protein ACRC5M_06045 [Anaeroplasmataceae bacterium]
MNCLKSVSKFVFSPEIVAKLIKLYEYKGKEYYYETILKNDADYISKDIIEREILAFVELLKLNVSDNKIKLIIRKDSTPKSNEERIVHNLKSVMKTTYEKSSKFVLDPNEILSLARSIYEDVFDVKYVQYSVKQKENLLITSKTISKRVEVSSMMDSLKLLLDKNNAEKTQAILAFYIDFINSETLNNYNDEVGLLLVYILLFMVDFRMFKYMSFFEILSSKFNAFNDAVNMANMNWSRGFSDLSVLHEIVLDIMLEGYQKLNSFVREYEFEIKLNKSDNIENTISKLPQVFTKDQIRERHPYTSESTINRALQKLRDNNMIRPNGTGRSATWLKLVETERFVIENNQISLFTEDDHRTIK